MSKATILTLVLCGAVLPTAGRAVVMSSENYSVYFGRIDANQIFASGNTTSEHYAVQPTGNGGVNQSTNTNSGRKTQKKLQDVEQDQSGLGGTVQDDNVNGSSPPPSDTSQAPRSAGASSSQWRGWISVAIIALFAFLLSLLVEKIQTRKIRELWR